MNRETELTSRRRWLRGSACGFGALAAAGLSGSSRQVMASQTSQLKPHFEPRGKRIIFLFMQGGVSQVDSFDHKELLEQRDGEMHGFIDARNFARSGERESSQRLMNSLWKFKRYGASERWVSDLFPCTAEHVDDLCFVHSMHTDGVAHGPSTLFLHCGSTSFIRPSLGSWLLYGLGTENENLPGFVSISPSLGNGGPRNYGSAFLPAIHQGTPIGTANPAANELTIRNLSPLSDNPRQQRERLDLLQSINQAQLRDRGHDSEWDAVLESYELAWRMQSVAPSVLNLTDETSQTLAMYGIGEKETDLYGRRCLLARRLCESGVRFVQVNYGDNSANPAWDQHSNLPKHAEHARAVDRPIAGLLADLKQRGLLEDTIVWWGGEFGRTPYAQKNGTGRDHNPSGFTIWLAGGGVRPGFAYGQTDEFGHQAIVDKVHMHDLHATLLHMLGLDHQRLTYRYAGRDFRLTDVHGQVVTSLFS